MVVGCSSSEGEQGDLAATTAVTPDQQSAQLDSLESLLIDGETLEADQKVAQQLLNESVAFVNENRQHPNAARHLAMAVGAAEGLKQFTLALELVDRIINDYPNSPNLAHMYYKRAFLLDYKMQQTEAAKAAYQDLIRKFPDYEYIQQAKDRLPLVGMDELDMIRMFEEQNADKDSAA